MVERSVALEGDHETDANERPLGSSCKRVVSMIFLKEWTLLWSLPRLYVLRRLSRVFTHC
jgi:hypothetical protein